MGTTSRSRPRDVAAVPHDAQATEAWLRKAIHAARELEDPRPLGRLLDQLAGLLRAQPGRRVEARQLAEHALAIAQDLDPTAADTWQRYGALANFADAEAATAADAQERAAWQAQARDYRELRRQAPRIATALARIDPAPSYARALILGRLGRCFDLGGRPDLAVMQLRQAIEVARLATGDDIESLRGSLHSQLAQVLHGVGECTAARNSEATAEAIAEKTKARTQALEGHPAEPPHEAVDAAAFVILLAEETMTDYVFEPDLLLEGTSEHRSARHTSQLDPVSDDVVPMLAPGARIWVDEDGTVRFCLPAGEPALERLAGCVAMRRIRREIGVLGSTAVLWRIVRAMDGGRTVAAILSGLASEERAVAARLLAALAAAGAIDVSGRAVARFLHAVTKKGVLPGGKLANEAVLQLATDGNYRRHAAVPVVALSDSVPEPLRLFRALTRARRSRRDYSGRPVSREHFDALLHTACGVTGAMPWAGREVKLRAYPSSGALYAVEIYPIVLRVEGLQRAVYHYRAVENVLEVINPAIDAAGIVQAALPVERDMVAGAAALICLAGFFQRHEQKYGQGGYRMMVAEAGHISQNLVLAATALGLSARPFGGVFDDLLNQDLGLDGEHEQFLLAVLVGHACACSAS